MDRADWLCVTIIAAIDFNPDSSNIARLAVRLARRFDDEVLLVHAVEPTISAFATTLPIAFPVAGAVDVVPVLENAEESLRLLRGGLAAEDVAIEARVVVGAPARALEDVAAETSARLIVAGSHGRGAAGRLLIGSVAQRLVLHAPCPVLVVRDAGGTSLERRLSGPRPLRLVVGIDRKGRATEAALGWVRQLCARGPCDVTIVHEYWPPAEYRRLGLRGPRDLFETDPEVAGLIERELEAKIGTLAWSPDARLKARASWGPIGEALAREAADDEADLVVVGSEQPHGWQRLKRGSTALSALHACALPLLCVPAHPHARPGTKVEPHPGAPSVAPALRSILVATDLSAIGNAAVAPAFSLLRAEGGVVHLCTVDEGPLPSPAYAYAPDTDAATPLRLRALEERLAALCPADARDLGIEARVSVIEGGDPAAEIVAAATRLGVDAIAIASHGRTGVKRAVLGSIAEAVLRRAEVPVYVVRQDDDDGG